MVFQRDNGASVIITGWIRRKDRSLNQAPSADGKQLRWRCLVLVLEVVVIAKVIVGMSGGVDSAAAACLLKQAGHDVIGITLRTWLSADGQEGRCCEIDDARKAAWTLGIRYWAWNCISEFRNQVITPFLDDYIHGLTPNPCTRCNRYVKWDKMLYLTKVFDADFIATGHYASVVKLPNGRYTVQKALHAEKDQTYMLYRLTQEQLAATLMPLGGISKQEAREIARQAGLSVADKADSQEICFVTDGNYADFIRENAGALAPGEGSFVDESGTVLGRHKGIIHYTVGQRKGLGLALGYPAYVKEIRPDRNEVVIGKEEELYRTCITVRDIHFMSIFPLNKGEVLRCRAKVRYHHKEQPACLEMIDEDNMRVNFDRPVRAAAPGQAAVFYDENDCVIGGGSIGRDGGN